MRWPQPSDSISSWRWRCSRGVAGPTRTRSRSIASEANARTSVSTFLCGMSEPTYRTYGRSPGGAGGEALSGGRRGDDGGPRGVGELARAAGDDVEGHVVTVVQRPDEAADVRTKTTEVRFHDGGVDQDAPAAHDAVLGRCW